MHIPINRKLTILVFILLCVTSGIEAQESRPTNNWTTAPAGQAEISPEIAERRLEEANQLYERGKTEAAIYALQQLEKADPTNYNVLFKLGEMAIAERNWAYAIEVLRKASLLRPDDIEVRIILMDIYRAYQMPIQEIGIGREIIQLDPNHLVANRRLAELYRDQAMHEDEILVRQKIMRLDPDDYENAKRLADIFDGEGSYWEAAKVYEHIRKHHPDNIEDSRRQAALYDKLKEDFRELAVLDDITTRGGGRSSYLQPRAERRQRIPLDVWDRFQGGTAYKTYDSDDLKTDTLLFDAGYLHIRPRSWYDLGGMARYAYETNRGQGDLAGDVKIHSTTAAARVVKHWPGEKYWLDITGGVLWEDVSWDMRARDPSSGLTGADYPILEDRSYGGVIPVGVVRFIAQPTLFSTLEATYDHHIMEDLDARLRMYWADRLTLRYTYETLDYAQFSFQVDESYIRGGNWRTHGMASAYYTLWGSGAMYDHNGKRTNFFRKPPFHFIRAGYILQYYDDTDKSPYYQTYNSEFLNTGTLLGRTRIFRLGPDDHLFLDLGVAYTIGSDSLDYRQEYNGGLLYIDYDSSNRISLMYGYEKEKDKEKGNTYYLKTGNSDGHSIALRIEWRFR